MRKRKHPGEYLHQYMLRENIEVQSLAAKMEVETDLLQDFINCKTSADEDLAQKLHDATGVSVGCWLNLQSQHDTTNRC